MSNDTLKDGRENGFYIIDNELLDHYGPTIGVYGVAVYNVLAQYANKGGAHIFPSYQTIAAKLGISRPKVIQTIALLIEVGLITKSARFDDAGDMTSNEYTLVNIKRGGKQHLLPSKPQIPPSKQDLPQVVNDVNQGGKQHLPDLDPINKTQLNKSVDAIAQPLLPVGSSTAESKPKPKKDTDTGFKSVPAIVAYRDFHNRFPQAAQMKIIAEAEIDNLELWVRVLHAWSGKGFSPVNVAGMIDWYKNPAVMDAKVNGHKQDSKPVGNHGQAQSSQLRKMKILI